MTILKSKYDPRRYFYKFHQRRHRWSILVAHRRAGKTVSVINDIIERATYNTRANPRYAYIAPLLRQAKDIAWVYLQEYAAPFRPKINQSELWVELTALPNSPRITLYGADNPDSFRGQYFDGVALDEFGNMKYSIWKEVLLPALVDRRGWAVFMGTPNGPNHFRDMFYEKKKDPSWFIAFLPVTETGVIPEDDLAEMKAIMDEEQYAQEMLCSFEASVRGAIYARQIEQMYADRRIGVYPLDKRRPVDLVMDLGYTDATAMGFCQRRFDGLLMGHTHSDNMKPIGNYIRYAKEFWGDNGYTPGQIWLPHDAKAKTLQTGKSIIDHFRKAHLRPKIVHELELLDGIAATRTTFPLWWINEPECEDLILALKSYHRKYDEEKKVYSNEPVHDWSSHLSDMFRYASIVQNPEAAKDPHAEKKTGKTQLVINPAEPVNYGATLADLFDANESISIRGARRYG